MPGAAPSSQRRTEVGIDTEARAQASKRRRSEALAVRLYAERRSYLLRIARRNSLSSEDAEDALQEAFLAFIRAFDPDGKAHPLAWLTLTLKRACWELHRREHLDRRAGQELGPGEEGPGVRLDWIHDPTRSPQERAELGAQVGEARGQLAQLKRDERRALGLLAVGYSYAEIGELTGWSHTKINRCIAEGRARLRELRRQAETESRTGARAQRG